MKHTIKMFALAAAVAAFTNSAFAGPGYKQGETIVCGSDCRPGGGDVPFPFMEANQQFELADGSPYNLFGKVVISPALDGSGDWIAYLVVDLKKHGWLLNDRRKADPRYPLMGSTRFWRQFDGAYVRLGGFAESQTLVTTKGAVRSEIWLAASVFRIERLPR